MDDTHEDGGGVHVERKEKAVKMADGKDGGDKNEIHEQHVNAILVQWLCAETILKGTHQPIHCCIATVGSIEVFVN